MVTIVVFIFTKGWLVNNIYLLCFVFLFFFVFLFACFVFVFDPHKSFYSPTTGMVAHFIMLVCKPFALLHIKGHHL